MWDILKNRWKQGYRTIRFPGKEELPDRFRGRPIVREGSHVDLRRCLFTLDADRDSTGASLEYSNDYRMATMASALDAKMKKLFGRSLKLREVCAGSCNGCDLELQALSNVVFDLSRFGIQFVASPRHADGLVVTGPVTKNMESALRTTYEAVPDPKIVIAVGACALSGGPFEGSPHVLNGVDAVLPVDLSIPGCPPHPFTILDGFLRLLGRIEDGQR